MEKIKSFTLLLVLLLSVSCLNTPNNTDPNPNPNEWCKGGNLHKAKISEWKKATHENKLATCADFMATVDNSISMDELKNRSNNLESCIDEATRDIKKTDDQNVSLIASMCIITLGYQKK